MTRNASSGRWLRRHVTDGFVQKASAQGWRSRAAFKLIEIDDRDRFLVPGGRVVDLGGAPGGWSQVSARRVGPGGAVVAVDLVTIAPISGVSVLTGDFLDVLTRDSVRAAIGERVDVVLSDLSPNISGVALADQARIAELVEQAAEFATDVLGENGTFLTKLFHGSEYEATMRMLRSRFKTVRPRKPDASRGESRETFALAQGRRR